MNRYIWNDIVIVTKWLDQRNSSCEGYAFEPRHVISNIVAFWHEQTETSLSSLMLSLESSNDVRSVAKQW